MDWLWRRIASRVPPVPSSDASSNIAEGATPEGVFREVAARQLDTQIETNYALDSRNLNIVWVGSTVLPVTFGLLSIGQAEVPRWAGFSLSSSIIFYALLLVCSWRASVLRGFGFRPDLVDLNEFSASYSGPLLEKWVALEYMQSTTKNADILKTKTRWIGASNTLLYLEGLALSIAAAFTLL